MMLRDAWLYSTYIGAFFRKIFGSCDPALAEVRILRNVPARPEAGENR
jgi:hypothetical protein